MLDIKHQGELQGTAVGVMGTKNHSRLTYQPHPPLSSLCIFVREEINSKISRHFCYDDAFSIEVKQGIDKADSAFFLLCVF